MWHLDSLTHIIKHFRFSSFLSTTSHNSAFLRFHEYWIAQNMKSGSNSYAAIRNKDLFSNEQVEMADIPRNGRHSHEFLPFLHVHSIINHNNFIKYKQICSNCFKMIATMSEDWQFYREMFASILANFHFYIGTCSCRNEILLQMGYFSSHTP